MKKQTNTTEDKLNKLEGVIGTLSPKIKQKPKKTNKRATFQTKEVVILVIITMVISLFMGTLAAQKLIFPYNHKNDKELSELIKNYEYITKNYNGKIDKSEIVDSAINGMLSRLDKNSNYLDSTVSKNFDILLEGKYSGLGIQVYNQDKNIVIYSVFENSPADKAGLKAGDIITSINGKSTENMPSEKLAKIVKESKNGEIKLTYKRENKEKKIKLNIAPVNINSAIDKTFEKKDKTIGYIGLGIFANNSYQQFKEKLTKLEKKNIDSLIIDLRGNSGGYLYVAESIISLFVDSSHVIYKIEKDKDITSHYSKGNETKKYKIIIIIDNNSASASEIVASALSEQYGATLIGTKSYGKGTVQELQNLKSGDKYKLTTKNWLTSKGTWVNEKGIEPDIKIELNEKYFEDPTEENDNQLQKAIDEAIK